MIDDGSLVLGYVHNGTVRAEFMRCVLNVTTGPAPDRRIAAVMDESAGSLIAKARNQLVGRFLSTACEWLWMVDTDVVFSTGALLGLSHVADQDERQLVSGVVQIARPDGSRHPSVFELSSNEHGLAVRHIPMSEWPRDGHALIVDATGAACLLAHRDVLEKVQAEHGPRWFTPVEVENGIVGEDISFCMRAGALGVRPVVATKVHCGHVRPVVIGSIL